MFTRGEGQVGTMADRQAGRQADRHRGLRRLPDSKCGGARVERYIDKRRYTQWQLQGPNCTRGREAEAEA